MKRFALGLPLICLAACDNYEIDMKNASPEEVAAAMRDKSVGFANPGKWQQTMTLMEIDAPGVPPEAKAMMQQAMQNAQINEICLTKEQANNPRADFFTGQDQNCTYEHFKWGGGKIDLKLNCQLPNAPRTMMLTGDYQPDSYSMIMTADTQPSGASAKMTMTMKVDGRRTGDCDGSGEVQLGS